ncbi:MAG TPA: high frequency lysogenization protein HflD [Cellvibrionaceae bacterium]|nr:high frequency lysogenization protein HflD [Cellvibrionaceae bacterium]
MELNRWQQLALSLSGVIHAVILVDRIAQHGSIANADLEPCLRTLFKRNPKDTLDVYGQLGFLLNSMEVLHNLLTQQRNPQHANLLRYCMGVLHLQKKLSKNSKMLAEIGAKLDKAASQVDMFGICSDNLVANLAETYSNTISTFSFRIQVLGEANYLQQPRLANLIRSLLLAAIRSAMLWHQVGGKRWHFIFYRKQLTQALDDLIKAAKSEIVNH